MIMLDDIKRDREAGTPGPWRVGPVDDTRVEARDGSEVAQIDGDYNQPETWPMMEANARRIARVPEMEARILSDAEALKAADELADRIAKAQSGWPHKPGWVDEALTAYRKAREARNA